MFANVDKTAEALGRWAGEVASLSWSMLSQPRSFWNRLRALRASDKLTLPPFGTLVCAVLALDLILAFSGGHLTSLASATPKSVVDDVAAQWPFLLHAVGAVGSAVLLSGFLSRAFRIPAFERSMVNYLAAFPASLALFLSAVGTAIGGEVGTWLLLMLLMILIVLNVLVLGGVGVQVGWPSRVLPSLAVLSALLLTAIFPVVLFVFVVISADAMQKRQQPWIRVALDNATVADDGLLSGRLSIHSSASQNIIIQRERAYVSLRAIPDVVPIRGREQVIQTPIRILRWNAASDSPVLPIEPNRDAWLEWSANDLLECRLCISDGFHLLLVFSLDGLSDLPPQEPSYLPDVLLGVKQPKKGERVMVIRCTMQPEIPPDSVLADLKNKTSSPLRLNAGCRYVPARLSLPR